MRDVRVHCAQPTGDKTVEPVTIQIATTFPDIEDGNEARLEHQSDADAIADALWQSLPGGTLDELTAALLLRRASLLRVAFPKEF